MGQESPSRWVLVAAAAAALAVGIGVSALAATPGVTLAASPTNISGTWTCCGTTSPGTTQAGTQDWAITESSSGVLTGTGLTPSGSVFATITGSQSGSNVTIVTTYTVDVGYVATFTGTVSASGTTMSGNWSSTDDGSSTGQSGSWIASLVGGTGTTTTGTTTTTPRRPSVTLVVCNYTFADDTDVCTATVGDATGQAAQPTGTVAFTSTVPGTTFSGGGSCALAPQTGDVGVTSCSVSYEGTETQSLQATASYSGDSTFAPSTGATEFLLAGSGTSAYSPTIRAFDPPTLNTTIDIPAGGATVTVDGDVTSDLTEQAVCQLDRPGAESAGDVASAGAQAFVARAPSVPRSVLVRVVRRYKHGGRVRLALRFNARALARDFPHTTRVQVVVTVMIRSPRGGTVTLFRRENLLLHIRRTARGAIDAFVASGSSTGHTWQGSDSCGLFRVTIAPPWSSPVVTVSWSAVLTCAATSAISPNANGGEIVNVRIAPNSTTGTLVAPGVYSYSVAGTEQDTIYSVSGELRIGSSGPPSGSGTAVGSAEFARCSAAAPGALIQTQ